MGKIFQIIIFIFVISFFKSQDISVEKISDFYAKDWKLIQKAEGDLDKDGKEDVAFVIEKTDKNNLKKNEFLGSDTLNLNPRRILVALKKEGKYFLKVDNINFIPKPSDSVTSCLADPFEEGLSIEKGVLKINLNYWYSCGSWYTNQDTYTFRYQNNKFEMIGFDYYEFHRASGEASSTSINYSTKKKIETTSLNEFNESKPKSKVSKIKEKPLYDLNKIILDYNFPEERD